MADNPPPPLADEPLAPGADEPEMNEDNQGLRQRQAGEAPEDQAQDQAEDQDQPDQDPPAVEAPFGLPRRLPLPTTSSSFTSYSLLAYLFPLLYSLYVGSLYRYNFFLTISHCSSGKIMPILLANLAVVASVQVFNGAIRIFFSKELSTHERDELGDHVKYSLTELCLALNIFRSTLSASTVALFLLLMLIKTLSQAAQTRLALLPTYTDDRRHTGLGWMLGVLVGVHALLANYHIGQLTQFGPSSHILFLFENSILLFTSLILLVRYFLHLSLSPDSPAHSNCTFMLDITLASLRLTAYLMLFCVIFHYFTLPLNTLRALYVSYVQLAEAIERFRTYRELLGILPTFPAASAAQLLDEAGERHECIICREAMESALVLPCRHCFHDACLRQWLVRGENQTCPTCRKSMRPTRVVRDEANAAAAVEPVAEGEAQPVPVVEAARAADATPTPTHAAATIPVHSPLPSAPPPTPTTVPAHSPQPPTNLFAASVFTMHAPSPFAPLPAASSNSPYPCLVRSTKSSPMFAHETGDAASNAIGEGVTILAIERANGRLRVPRGWLEEDDVEYLPVQVDVVSDVLRPYLRSPAGKGGAGSVQELQSENERLREEIRRLTPTKSNPN